MYVGPNLPVHSALSLPPWAHTSILYTCISIPAFLPCYRFICTMLNTYLLLNEVSFKSEKKKKKTVITWDKV